MRLSRLGTDGSLPPDYQGFRAASELGRSILAAGQPSSCRPTTDRGCKAAIQGAALTAESGGATRAALLAMRAHRGTGRFYGAGGEDVATSSLQSNRWSAAMPQSNDLSRSLVALDQNSTIIAVVELSQSSWLVGG